MSEVTELEKLVVRLIGDASGLDATLDAATKDLESAVTEMEDVAVRAVQEHEKATAAAAKSAHAAAAGSRTYANEVTRGRDALGRFVSAQTSATAASGRTRDAMGRFRSATSEASRELDDLQDALEDAEQQANDLQNELDELADAEKDAADEAKASAEAIEASWAKVGAVGSQLQSIGAGLERMGTALTVGVTTPIVGFGALSIHEFGKFDAAMTTSTSIMGDLTEAQVDLMKAEAERLVAERKTISSADELGKTYYFLASAGYSAEQSVKGLGTVAQFAAAGESDLEQATSLLADAQSALGLKTKDASKNMENMVRVADVLVEAGNASNASVTEFSEALTNKAAGAMRQASIEIEDGVAVLAAYADQGKKGRVAGEMYTIMLREMQNAAQTNTKAWREMGIAAYDADGKLRPVSQIIRELDNKTKGMSDEMKFAAFQMLGFHSESLDAIRPLLGMSDAIESYAAQLRAAGGVTEEVAAKQMASFNNQLLQTWNQMKLVAIEVGEILAPSLEMLNGYVQDGIMWWRGLDKETKQFIVGAAGVLAAIGPMVLMFGILVSTVGAVTAGIAAMVFVGVEVVAIAALITAALAALVVGAVAVVAAIGYMVYATVGPEGLAAAWEYATDVAEQFVSDTIGFFENFQHNYDAIVVWVQEQWANLWADALQITVRSTLAVIENLYVFNRTAVRLFSAFFGWLGGQFMKVFTADFWKAVGQGIVGATNMFLKFADQIAKVMWNALRGKKVDVSEFIEGMTKDFTQGFKEDNFLKTAGDILREEAGNLRHGLSDFESNVTKGPGLKLDRAITQAHEETAKVKDALSEGLVDAMDQAKAAAATAQEGLTEGLAGDNEHLTAMIEASTKEGKAAAKLAKREAAAATREANALQRKAEADIKAHDRRMASLEKEEQNAAEKYYTPLEKMKKEQEEITKLFEKGKLSAEAYYGAILKSQQEMNKELKIDFKVGGADTFLAGGYDALLNKHEVETKMRLRNDALTGGINMEAGVIGSPPAEALRGGTSVYGSMLGQRPTANREEIRTNGEDPQLKTLEAIRDKIEEQNRLMVDEGMQASIKMEPANV